MATLTPPDRIRELSAINGDVADLLKYAGRAMNAITNRPLSACGEEGEEAQMANGNSSDSIDGRKEAFERHATAYYSRVQAIQARLRRQTYALEEAGIIAAEAPGRTAASAAGRGPGVAAREVERITNGGLGNLDIGWLNSRGNKVGAEKEAELVGEAKRLVEEMLSDRGTESSR